MYIIRFPQKPRVPAEGVIAEWLFFRGQEVEKGGVIARIDVFGQMLELESPVSAQLLEILVPAGTAVVARQPLAILGNKGDDIEAVLNKLAPQAPAAQSQSVPPVQSVSKPSQPQTVIEPPKEVKMEPKVPAGKVIPILMPQAGQTMEEGTLLSWKVKAGDTITVGQVIFEIETDKATMEVEAANAGRLARIVANEGQSVPVKTPVAYLADNDADVDAYIASQGTVDVSPKAAQSSPTQAAVSQSSAVQKAPASVSDTGRVKASPAARRMADQRGIDLATVGSGTGPGGRILSTDITSANGGKDDGLIHHPLSKMRKAIAQNLAYSKQNIPHFYMKLTIEAQVLFDLYKQLKKQYPCSVNDFVTLACARAIRQFAAFRSQYANGEILENPSVNIGVAVGTDNGLTVPVLLNVDQMNLQQLSARTKQMAENARNGKVEGVGQGVFTITNMGMFGVEEFLAIINPPESAILSVGAIREDIKVENGTVRPTRLMTMCLSVDHRVIDGVAAAQFLAALKQMLEKPQSLV